MVDSVGMVNAVAGAPSYSGRALRQLNGVGFAGATAARPLGARSGVRPGTPTSMVTATSTTWTCQPFAGLLDGQAAAEAGPYTFAFDAVATGAIAAASASIARVDIIYVRVDDPSESDGSTVPAATRKYLAGTVASTPPATPARSIVIAHINVPISGGGSPTVTWKAPYCAAAGGTVDFNTKAELDLWLTAPKGQRARVLATGLEYVSDGAGAWPGGVATNLQLDTANSVVQTITQVGIGKITGNGTGILTEVVTFPVAFAAVPFVASPAIGVRSTGAFNPAGLAPVGTVTANPVNQSATAFTVDYRAVSGTFGATNDFYYSWIAIGVPA